MSYDHIIYLRTSTEEQDPENQKADVLKIAPDDSMILLERQSAWNDNKNRPVFEKIVSMIKRRLVSEVYVWDLDRIYRDRAKLKGFFALCKSYDVKVFSVNQSWLDEIMKAPEPWDDIVYSLLIDIFGYIAQEESDKKSRRVKSAYNNMKSKGEVEDWGRPKAKFNEYRAYFLLFEEGKSTQDVADEVGVSKATVWRFKKRVEKEGVSFIKGVDVSELTHIETNNDEDVE